MNGIIRLAFAMVQNLHVAKIFGEFAGHQAMQGWLLPRFGDVHQGDDYAARSQAALGGLKEIALQIVRNADEVPGFRLDAVFPFFEIGDAGVNRQAALPRTVPQHFDGGGRAVHRGHLPSALGQPQRIAAGAASEVQCTAGRQLTRRLSQQRHRHGCEILGCALARTITLFPETQFHAENQSLLKQNSRRQRHISIALACFSNSRR